MQGYTVYNHMLLPTFFESVEADYHHLKRAVQVWDVSCERQVEIRGKDAAFLVQTLTPRDLRPMNADQCYYMPLVDERGGMLNDPVLLRPDEERWWISIADSDALLWVKGFAAGMKLDVHIHEPEVAPLAVQGPQSDRLMARIFGEEIREVRFFRFKRFDFEGHSLIIARSGYSRQGGFEIYVEGSGYAEALWDALMTQGEDLDLRAGCPNAIERVEGGLLSYGNDMTSENTPLECGLDRFYTREAMENCIGGDHLLAEWERGPSQQIRGLVMAGERVPPCQEAWPVKSQCGTPVGQATSAVWSPDLNSNLAIAMITQDHWQVGAELLVETPTGEVPAVVHHLPFLLS